jgi:hypothetical protein
MIMAGYRDDQGKFTEQRFFTEDVHSDVTFIIDRETDSEVASCWTKDKDLADRITQLLNERGLVDALFMAK